jgi:16S rRNA (cytidine1402-2'-O)-methyltransferase
MSLEKKVYPGVVYMIPCPIGSETVPEVLPADVITQATALRHFAVEDLKSARRFLRRMDREFPIDDSTFFILNKKTPLDRLEEMLQPVLKGASLGVISEAGCPGIADPGADLVALAHEKEIKVRPLVGPSSILLALIGSGFNGQQFTFHGYLPKDRKDRIRVIKEYEFQTIRSGHTNLFMDTPFRNMNVLDDLLNQLSDQTELCVASNITGRLERVESKTVADWREKAYDLAKSPTIFAIGKSNKAK